MRLNNGPQFSWVRLCLGTATAVALVFAALFATLALAMGQTSNSGDQAAKAAERQTFSGVISDERCGGRHTVHPDMSVAQCTLACAIKGSKFALVDGDIKYVLQGHESEVTKLAGTRVQISGSLSSNNVLTIASISQ